MNSHFQNYRLHKNIIESSDLIINGVAVMNVAISDDDVSQKQD